jgi:tetratricopeptide (TPR) repeat protein
MVSFFTYNLYDILHTETEYFFKKGVYYEEIGLHNLAIGSFKRALKYKKGEFSINPQDLYQLESLYNLGVIYYMQKKDYPRALSYFNHYLEIFPETEEIKNPHKEDIYKVINYILSMDDKTTNIEAKRLKEQGNEYFFNKNYDKAIECYINALKLDPGYVEVYNNLASCYFYKNDLSNAVKFWKIVLLFEPNNLDLYINIALACETSLNKPNEAIYYYEQFIEKAPPSDQRVPLAKEKVKQLNTQLQK